MTTASKGKRAHRKRTRRQLRRALKDTAINWIRRGIHSVNWGSGLRKHDLGDKDQI